MAAIESGRRELTAAEVLLLPLVLHEAFPEEQYTFAADLLREHRGWIRLGPDALVDAMTVEGLARSMLPHGVLQNFEAEMPATRESMRRAAADFARLKPYREWWPRAPIADLAAAELEAAGVAEQKAAASLGVPAIAIAVTARRLWARSLTAERDARVPHAETDQRSLQALRGHVTRSLLEELRPTLKRSEA